MKVLRAVFFRLSEAAFRGNAAEFPKGTTLDPHYARAVDRERIPSRRFLIAVPIEGIDEGCSQAAGGFGIPGDEQVAADG